MVVRGIMGLAGWLAGGAPTQAYDAPAIVIPGKRGVPVIIDGYDAPYCVVEGDWGLARPGHVAPTIIACPLLYSRPQRAAVRRYFPGDGGKPGYGRKEIEPAANRRLPPPAPSFNREWQSGSDPLPATIDPPPESPPLFIAPEITRRKRAAQRPADTKAPPAD
jgi:hypothetical protein